MTRSDAEGLSSDVRIPQRCRGAIVNSQKTINQLIVHFGGKVLKSSFIDNSFI